MRLFHSSRVYRPGSSSTRARVVFEVSKAGGHGPRYVTLGNFSNLDTRVHKSRTKYTTLPQFIKQKRRACPVRRVVPVAVPLGRDVPRCDTTAVRAGLFLPNFTASYSVSRGNRAPHCTGREGRPLVKG